MATSVEFAEAMARAVAGWLLTYAIHSTILLGATAVVALRLREQHAWLDWLWKVGLVGAVVTTTAQSALGVQPLGGRWRPWPDVAAASANAGMDGAGLRVEPAAERDDAGVAMPVSSAAPACCGSAAVAAAERARSGRISVADSARAGAAFLTVAWPLVLAGAWFALAVLALTRFGVRQRTLYRVLGGRRPVSDPRLTDALGELRAASGLRRPLRLTLTARCPVPVALLRGEIVVPERFLCELDGESQRAALAHEVAHQMRRDPQWLLLVYVLQAVFFFQPLQRRAARGLRDSAEVLCDDWAVQQTVSIGVARCLATVASWVSPAREWQLTAASAMACSQSALLRRVDRVLRSQRVPPTRRALAVATLLFLPLLLLVAPVVTSADIPVSPTLLTRVPAASRPQARQPAEAQSAPVPALAAHAEQERVIRAPRPDDPLEARWSWTLQEAARRRFGGFFVVYSFYRPVTRDQQFISDSYGVDFSSRLFRMTPLSSVLDGASPIGGRGTIAAVFHFAGADDRRIDRIGHRSMSLGYDFAGEPVFWLGYADEPASLARLERVFASVAAPDLRVEVVETYGIHPTTDRVLPFLTRALRPEMNEKVRAEAAESLEHHADPRVVPLLVRTARSDASPAVRAEAAEALGEVNVHEAIPALVELATKSGDSRVRAEAAEALGDQAPDRALPALAQLIDESRDSHVLMEAVEALGSLHTHEAVDALVRIVWGHGSPDVQREAVETLGDFTELDIVEHLEKIVVEHADEQVVMEALDVLGERNDARSEQRIAAAARTSPSAHVRREALQLLGEAHADGRDRPGALSAEQFAAVLERAIFEDPDRGVQLEALDVAAESLPRAQARRLLRRVAEEHPSRAVRAEALDLLEEIG